MKTSSLTQLSPRTMAPGKRTHRSVSPSSSPALPSKRTRLGSGNPVADQGEEAESVSGQGEAGQVREAREERAEAHDNDNEEPAGLPGIWTNGGGGPVVGGQFEGAGPSPGAFGHHQPPAPLARRPDLPLPRPSTLPARPPPQLPHPRPFVAPTGVHTPGQLPPRPPSLPARPSPAGHERRQHHQQQHQQYQQQHQEQQDQWQQGQWQQQQWQQQQWQQQQQLQQQQQWHQQQQQHWQQQEWQQHHHQPFLPSAPYGSQGFYSAGPQRAALPSQHHDYGSHHPARQQYPVAPSGDHHHYHHHHHHNNDDDDDEDEDEDLARAIAASLEDLQAAPPQAHDQQPASGYTFAAGVTSHSAHAVDEDGWELYDPAALVDVDLDNHDEQEQQEQQQDEPAGYLAAYQGWPQRQHQPAPAPVFPAPVSARAPAAAPGPPSLAPTHTRPPQPDPRLSLWRQENRRFAGTVLIEDREPAINRAKAAVHQSLLTEDGALRLTFFVDGSKIGGNQTLGGYGVVFRKGAASELLASPAVVSSDRRLYQQQDEKFPASESGGLRAKDFTICSWASKEVSALETSQLCQEAGQVSSKYLTCFWRWEVYDANLAEKAAIAQALHLAIQIADKGVVGSIEVFSDSQSCLGQIQRRSYQHGQKQGLDPLIRAIIWMSHYLKDKGCNVRLFWNKRCCALGPGLADAAAGAWQEEDRVLVDFGQERVPL
ncbi:hypothetical protein B0T20DRAFT_502150 [Sordaria brevicollis]|uniref:Uncharacterized protein n=1 Tax=Sordaria brevicollis TaxID=83679 RepID=A0AAE0PB52_SORBR|nr:hypothetical protein B0T20DRAFT_502150 [Sordaria brevicollis]